LELNQIPLLDAGSFIPKRGIRTTLKLTITFAHKPNLATNCPNSYGTWDQFLTHFEHGLKPTLLLKLCNSRDIPTKIEAMYKKVISIENTYQLLLSHRTLNSDS
jgi:hypothetical protein